MDHRHMMLSKRNQMSKVTDRMKHTGRVGLWAQKADELFPGPRDCGRREGPQIQCFVGMRLELCNFLNTELGICSE